MGRKMVPAVPISLKQKHLLLRSPLLDWFAENARPQAGDRAASLCGDISQRELLWGARALGTVCQPGKQSWSLPFYKALKAQILAYGEKYCQVVKCAPEEKGK